MVKKIVSLTMAAVIFLSIFSFRVCASALPDYRMSDSQWDEYWNEVKDDNTQILLSPGADETKLNFSWHSQTGLYIPVVRISKNADMSGYKEFKGFFTPAEKGQQTNRVTVSGLEENTVYYYTYSVYKDTFSEPEIYRTLSPERLKAIYIGDAQCDVREDGYANIDAKNWNTLISNAVNNNPDTAMILHLGDQTQHGDNALEWAGTLSPKVLRNIPFATTVGNHDKKGHNYQFYVNNPNSYYGYTPSTTGRGYYFTYGGVLFVSINSTQYNVFDQYNLVEKAVAENPDTKWRVLMLHHDIYGTGHHARDNESLLMQAYISAICDKFNIDVCLSGHEHFYGRSYFMYDNNVVDMDYSTNEAVNPKGTLYLTAASGSGKNRNYDEYIHNDKWICFDYMTPDMIYSTVEFTDSTFNVSTYDMDENIIDTYTIVKTKDNSPEVNPADNLLFGTNTIDRILRTFTGEYYVIFRVVYKVVDILKLFLTAAVQN